MNLFQSFQKLRYPVDHLIYPTQRYEVKLNALKKNYDGRPVVIVGNGPSLNKTPLDQMHGMYFIGMNKIHLGFDKFGKWRPDVILATNRHVIEQCSDEYVSSEIPILLPWQQRFFLKAKAKTESKIIYTSHLHKKGFSEEFVKYVNSGPTVTYFALQLAYFLRAKEIYLVGVDHSFVERGPKNKLITSSGNDQNHFHKDYFGKGVKWNLPDLEASEKCYDEAARVFDSQGSQVFDATIGGKLEVFPKVDIAALIDVSERSKLD